MIMKTLIIDNYDSFTYNLYQLVGSLKGNPTVVRNDQLQISDIERNKFSHIIISPGPGSPEDESYFGICKQVILQVGKTVPILGVCLGHQGIIHAFGGKIVQAEKIMHGKQSKIYHQGTGILKGVKNPLISMRYHSLVGDKSTLPSILTVTAQTKNGTIMAVTHKKYEIYGIQFHPESIGTEQGRKIMTNFLNLRPKT